MPIFLFKTLRSALGGFGQAPIARQLLKKAGVPTAQDFVAKAFPHLSRADQRRMIDIAKRAVIGGQAFADAMPSTGALPLDALPLNPIVPEVVTEGGVGYVEADILIGDETRIRTRFSLNFEGTVEDLFRQAADIVERLCNDYPERCAGFEPEDRADLQFAFSFRERTYVGKAQ